MQALLGDPEGGIKVHGLLVFVIRFWGQLVLLLISLCLSYFCFPKDLGFRVSGPSVAETPEAQIRDPVVRTWVELNSQKKFKPRLNPDSNSCRRKESESRLNLGSNFPRLDLCALA